jgi:phosphoribosylformimino-5-aminoimidazole carboxamide ribotide isomerase
VKSEERIERLLVAGASRVVVGTRAVEDRDWREKVARAYPSKLVVAADVRGRNVVTHGWAKTLDLDVKDLVDELNTLPLAGVLATAVHVEGKMQGPDLPLMAELAQASHWPLYASGGISSLADLKALNDKGVFGVVIGMALYTGALDPAAVAKEYVS